jgi:hypothetical protein
MCAVCHCRNCQKQAGSAFSIIVAVPADGLLVQGETKTYVDHGDSGNTVLRIFCPQCGSPLISDVESPAFAGLRFIKAGTLDDPSWLAPGIHVWCGSKQPWVTIDRATPQFAANP